MTTRKYTSRSQQTTLSSAVTSGATIFPVVAVSTLLPGVTLSAGETITVVIDPDTALEEIIDITSFSTSSNNITVSRGIDGSSAQDHSAGAVVRHMIIGRDLRESNQHIEASTNIHGLGLGAAIVGDITTQTISNKTLGSNLAAGGFKITGLGTPTVSTDAATKGYIDTSTTSAAASATAAATSASSAATSASSAATSASSALTSQTAAATSASSAATSQTAAATSATSAAASATAAATSATSAAASATAAATSATSAANSATAASTSASSAATSASSALTSQTAAATSATSAAASATAAATSASSASVSATAAATSATSAAASATAAASTAATLTIDANTQISIQVFG